MFVSQFRPWLCREYFQVARVLAPFILAPMSFDTTSIFTTLQFELNGYFPLFLEDYKPDWDLELSFDSFKLVFQRMSHLSINDSSGMVFEHLQDFFHFEDSTNGFL
jgi:hypothetical protein